RAPALCGGGGGGRGPLRGVGASAGPPPGRAGPASVLLAGCLSPLPFSVVVPPEPAPPADLKGKAIGVNRFGSSNDFAARLALTRLGLQPDRDVTLLQLGPSSARLAALQARGIHGAVLEPRSLAASRPLRFPQL